MTWKTKFILLLCLFAGKRVLANENIVDPLSLFHQGGDKSEIVGSIVFNEGELQIKVFLVDQREPYNKPFTYQVFFRCGEGDFMRLDRANQGHDALTYCAGEEPRVVEDEPSIGMGRFLILTGFASIDEVTEPNLPSQECAEQATIEFYPIEGIRQLCL